jgi:putative ABC transport system permease protein
MGILLGFTFKNILGKKLRTFILFFSILVSTGVFFASLSISSSVQKMILEGMKGIFGDSDLYITSGPQSPSVNFLIRGAEKYSGNFEYIIGQIKGTASYIPRINEEYNISLTGADFDEMQRLTPAIIEQQNNLLPFSGKKIIISSNTADKFNLKVGNAIEMKFGPSRQRFLICGIAAPTGAFLEDGESIPAVVPLDTVRTLFNSRGKVNILFIKLKDASKKDKFIGLLSSEYKNYKVREPIPEDVLKKSTSQMSSVFLMLSCVVFFMSVYIIYSSFKVIVAERLPVIGTLRSIGATRTMTNTMLLYESLMYGIIGGVLGCIAGVGILYVMSAVVSKIIPAASGMKITVVVDFPPLYLLLSLLMAIILCFLGSIMPIAKVSRISTKDIILNVMQAPKKRGRIKLILGISAIVIGLILSTKELINSSTLISGLGIMLSLAALLLLVPYVIGGFLKIFEKIYMFIFGNIGIIAAKNLRENQNIIGSITMLSIGISSLLVFNTAQNNSIKSVVDSFSNTFFDIVMTSAYADRDFVRKVYTIDGIEDVYEDYEFNNIEVVGQDNNIKTVKGVDKQKFADYWRLATKEDPQPLLNELDEGRSIMLTDTLKGRYNLNKGDYIRLKMKNKELEYKVIGFFDSLMGNADCALISERFLKTDMAVSRFTCLYIKTRNDPLLTAEDLRKEFLRWKPTVETKSQVQKRKINNSKGILMLVNGFSILAMLLGSFGVCNNLIISFMERRHSLAVYRSIGMSKRQTTVMMFVESLTGGLIGGMLGILGGLLMTTLLAGVDSMGKVEYQVNAIISYFIIGVLVMLVSSISPSLKSPKLDIVSVIKFE